MTISTGAIIEQFGTQVLLTSTTSEVADGAFNTTGVAWTNTDDVVMASVTLSGSFASNPYSSTTLNLYARLMNVVSTNDEGVPDANNRKHCLGCFIVDQTTATQFCTIDVSLPNAKTSQEYEFFIENDTGFSLNAGWDLYITPKSIIAKA